MDNAPRRERALIIGFPIESSSEKPETLVDILPVRISFTGNKGDRMASAFTSLILISIPI